MSALNLEPIPARTVDEAGGTLNVKSGFNGVCSSVG